MSKQYYYSDKNYAQAGPIPEDLLIQSYRAGQYTAQTLVWCVGMSQWQHVDFVMARLGVELLPDANADCSLLAAVGSVADAFRAKAKMLPANGGELKAAVTKSVDYVSSLATNKEKFREMGDKARALVQSLPKNKEELMAARDETRLFAHSLPKTLNEFMRLSQWSQIVIACCLSMILMLSLQHLYSGMVCVWEKDALQQRQHLTACFKHDLGLVELKNRDWPFKGSLLGLIGLDNEHVMGREISEDEFVKRHGSSKAQVMEQGRKSGMRMDSSGAGDRLVRFLWRACLLAITLVLCVIASIKSRGFRYCFGCISFALIMGGSGLFASALIITIGAGLLYYLRNHGRD